MAHDDAIYIAARIYDQAPDSIVARLGRRDQDLDADNFAVGIDSYHDKQTGFYFSVNPAGSIGDGTISNDSWFEDTWDGVWDYGVQLDSQGWSVEMRIPYSQLRFTRRDEYIWGFHWRGNIINQHLALGYRWYQPGKIFRNASLFVSNFRNFDFDGNRTDEGVMLFFNGQFLNYYGFHFDSGYFPETLDISRTRGGPLMKYPAGYFFGLSGKTIIVKTLL